MRFDKQQQKLKDILNIFQQLVTISIFRFKCITQETTIPSCFRAKRKKPIRATTTYYIGSNISIKISIVTLYNSRCRQSFEIIIKHFLLSYNKR
jgi:hypothetical protein